MLEWILACIGPVVGGLIAFLIQERRSRAAVARAEQDCALAQQQAVQLRTHLDSTTNELNNCRDDNAAARAELASTLKELALVRETSRQQLEQQSRSIADALSQMRDAFALLSQDALKANADSFLQLAATRFEQLSTQATGTLDERKAQIESLLKPLQETLCAYQQRLNQIEQSRQEGYGKLLEQLGSVGEVGRNLERQTTQLVMALKRPTTRGQWGEITLRRLVELAGMSEHCDFCEQQTVFGDDELRQRPDLVVNLPNRRTIIVDSKASLDKFLDAAACEDEQRRNVMLTAHAADIRGRARELAQKAYWNQFDTSPDFVIMFLPGEAFLYAAVERDASVIEDAMKDRVIIATPTTLIALLKAVEYGWRQESMTENAEEIRKLGVELHERLAIVAGYLGTLGERMKKSVDAYNSLVGSFDARVMVTARKFGELGARSDQELIDPEPVDVQPRILTASAPVATVGASAAPILQADIPA